MEHAAVVAGLMCRQLRFLFNEQGPHFGPGLQEPECRSQPHYAASENDYVVIHQVIVGLLTFQVSRLIAWERDVTHLNYLS